MMPKVFLIMLVTLCELYVLLQLVSCCGAETLFFERHKRQVGSSYGSYAPAKVSYDSACPPCSSCGPACIPNPCFYNSLPYHCTLEQCTQTLKDNIDFLMFAPNISIPKCFFSLPGFKIFSFNACVKDTAKNRPEDATKTVVCSGGSASLAACFVITAPPGESPNPANGYVVVSSNAAACSGLTVPSTVITCSIVAKDGTVVGNSNEFTVTITTAGC